MPTVFTRIIVCAVCLHVYVCMHGIACAQASIHMIMLAGSIHIEVSTSLFQLAQVIKCTYMAMIQLIGALLSVS